MKYILSFRSSVLCSIAISLTLGSSAYGMNLKGDAAGNKADLQTGIEINDFAKKQIKLDGSTIGSPDLKCIEFPPTSDPFQEAVNNAAITAMARDPELVEVDNTLSKMRGKGQKSNEVARNFAHYLLNYRGVGPSSDGANALMERKIKASNTITTELKWEKAIDEKYVETVMACAELADALDRTNDADRQKALAAVTTKLDRLLGAEGALSVVTKFKALKNVMPVAPVTESTSSLGVSVERERIAALTESVMKNDEVVAEVAKKLSNFTVTDKTQAVTGLAQGVLGVAGLAPSFVGPAAQVLKTVLILSTGGSEENKLFKEVFLFKRLEVRTRTISNLATTAVRSHNLATLTNRPFLKAYSEAMMRQLGDDELVKDLLAGKYDDGKYLEEQTQKDSQELAVKLASEAQKEPVSQATAESIDKDKDPEQLTQ